MKTPFPRRASGFTLIELLVVIAIIAVLAAAGFTAGTAALNKARRVTALNVATSIEQAVNNFYNEYNVLPSEDAEDTTYLTNEDSGKKLIHVLTNHETADPPMNTKGINYLSIKEGRESGTGGRDGMIYTDAGVPDGIYDPWGGPYKIRLDMGYDEKLEVQPKGASASRNLNARRVAVWSDGADGTGTTNGKSSDDVVTW